MFRFWLAFTVLIAILPSPILASTGVHWVEGRGSCHDAPGTDRSSACASNPTYMVTRASNDQSATIREVAQGEDEDEQTPRSITMVAKVRAFLAHYTSMSPLDALAKVNALLGEISALDYADADIEVWHVETELLDLRYTLQRETAAETRLIASREACYPALRDAGYDWDWAAFPLAFSTDMPSYNLGDFLCAFLRRSALVSLGQDENMVRVVIADIELTLAPRKRVASDDFYAMPNVSMPGDVKFAIVVINGSNGETRVDNFESNWIILMSLMQSFGAPLVQ